MQLVDERCGEDAIVLSEVHAPNARWVGKQRSPSLVNCVITAIPEGKPDGLVQGHCDGIEDPGVKHDRIVLSEET